MADHDHGFLLTRRNGILNVFRTFPFPGFARHEDIHLGHKFKHNLETGAAGIDSGLADFRLGISDDADCSIFQPALYVFGERP